MDINGYWYAADSSSRQAASLRFTGQSYQLLIADQLAKTGSIEDLQISDRVGDTQRRISWPDDSLFESFQNDDIDRFLTLTHHRSAGLGILHKLENRWSWVIGALLVTVLAGYVGIRYGLPAASEKIAEELPETFNQTVSDQALATLDRTVFDPSELDDAKQSEVQQQFNTLIANLPYEDIKFELHFRKLGNIPNAMALPGGDIVVTDEFIRLIEHPQELDSVLLHEIGHVVAHHGMTQVIRASAVSVIATLAFGDLSAMGDIAVGIPIFMMQNSYSQAAETDADDYAFTRMKEMGKDPKYFADIILRLADEPLDTSDDDAPSGYFSTHPDTVARARKAIEASRMK